MNFQSTKPFLAMLFATSTLSCVASHAQTARVRSETRSGLIVPGLRVGAVKLGQTRALVRQRMGRAPDSKFNLPRGLSSELWKWQPADNPEIHMLETVYRAGKVVQIEVSAPGFATARQSGSSGFLDDWYNEFGKPTRVRAYRYNAAKKGAARQKYFEWPQGFTLEARFQPKEGDAVGGDYIHTVLIHAKNARPITDFDGVLIR